MRAAQICCHRPAQPRRVPGRLAAVVRCESCGLVLERLGVVELNEAGLELGALLPDAPRQAA